MPSECSAPWCRPCDRSSVVLVPEATTVPGQPVRCYSPAPGLRLPHETSAEGRVAMTTVEQQTRSAIRPFRVQFPEESLADLRRRLAATRWPPQELVARRLPGRAVRDDAGALPLLGGRLRLAGVRGAAERAAAVHHRDRRGGHPLHPRALAACGRAAAGHDARLARLGHRDAGGHRPAHRPDRVRRRRRGRVPLGAAVPARLRLLRRADRDRLGPPPHREGLGGADDPPGLHPLRRAGRRPGGRRHRLDGRLAPEGLLGIHLNFLGTFPLEVLAAVFGGGPGHEGLLKRLGVASSPTGRRRSRRRSTR